MAKTCIRVEACNIGSSERHNLRSKELDYIRPELTHRNEQWVECSIAEVHRDITEKYKEATGQGLQKKATPIREGVIVISEETTIQQLQDLAEKLEERFGVHAFQIYTHKDEGANVWDGKEEAWKPNYHAHMIFDWTDGHTGKTVKLNRHDMAEMQTITAECLNMERGVSSDKKHLSAMQYKNKMETEKAEQLQKDIEQLNRAYTAGTEKITTVQKELSTAQKELNSMKTDIHINEAKEAAAKAGKTVFNAVTSVFNVGEVKRQAKEIETLKKENYNLSFKNQNLEGQLRTNNIEMRRVQETTDRQIKAEASKLKPITNLFPEMENAQENIEELQTMGIQNKDIRQLLIGKEIYYTGNLYDKDKRKSYQVKNVKIDISKSQNGITTIWLNNIWKIQCKLPPKTKRFCPLKTFNNAPLKSLDRWGYYYFSLFPSVCSHFTDTFSCQLNPVRRMYNTIHNGICYCRVSDCIIPIVRWQLRGDDDGLAPMSVLYYIEQDGSFLGIKVHKEEVIQYEQRAPFDSLEFRFQCAFYFCHLKRTHKFRSIRIICPYALLAGFIPHCCGKEALPGTG